MVNIGDSVKEDRYILPVSAMGFGGWKDYDKSVLLKITALEDKVEYLQRRLELVVTNSLDQVYLRTGPAHRAVNGPDMSFFFIGTTIICCCIEALGGFILHRHDGNKARFTNFLSRYMAAWTGVSAAGTDVSAWLWKELRNGLAHGLVIDKGGLEDLGNERFRDNPSGGLQVHTELLYKDFKSGVAQYFSDLRSQADAALVRNYEDHFADVFQTF